MARHLGLHALLLTVVLAATSALVGADGLVSADEGAMLAQLDLLDGAGEWTAPNPEPEVDPELLALPLELSERSADGRWAPFAKHPVHIAGLRPFWRAGGYGGTLVASILGTVAAAVAAGLLARRLAPGAEVAALWATGIGSPLLFDSFQVVGHAVGAGAFGLAAVAALAALDAPTARRAGVAALACVALAAAAGLVRSEAVLAVAALGVGIGALGGRGRPASRRAPLLGAGLVVVAAAVRLGEPRLMEAVLGADSIGTVVAAGGGESGLLAGRWSGFRVTVLDAGYGVDGGEPLLLVSVLLAVGAALAWRLRRDDRLVTTLAVASAVAALARMATADFLVPGLLMALPILAVALASVGAAQLRERDAAPLWATAALFAGAVVLTQYETGGTGEWGGRYFAVALPVVVALSVHVLAATGSTMPGPTRRVALVGLVVVSLTLAVGAVRAADRARTASEALADAVIAEVDALGVDATVSTRGAVSRFAWDDVLDGRRWLTTSEARTAEVGAALAADGARRVALVVPASTDPGGLLGEGWEVGEPREVRPGTAVALATNTRSPE